MIRCVSTIAAIFFATPLAAGTPRVATDLPIVGSLVAKVLGADDVTPIFDGTVSPHDWALRPSDARTLGEADLIVWMGPDLSPGLGRAIDAAATDTPRLDLIDVADVRREMDEDHEDSHEEGDDHGSIDPHAWLDPLNAAGWMDDIAEALAKVDPDNAATFRANAAAGRREILQSAIVLEGAFTDRSPAYIVAHDALGYFTDRFGVPPIGAVADHEAARPGAARIAELDERLGQSGATCLLIEQGTAPRLALSLAERHDVRVVEIDLVGAGLSGDPDGYVNWLSDLAQSIADCG